MPYIDQAARAEIAAGRVPKTPGELNFQLTRIVMNELAESGPLSYTACYEVIASLEAVKVEVLSRLYTGEVVCAQRDGVPSSLAKKVATALVAYVRENPKSWSLADVVATLECVKLEFYRRVVAPYEDQKCEQNGDAYHPFYGVL